MTAGTAVAAHEAGGAGAAPRAETAAARRRRQRRGRVACLLGQAWMAGARWAGSQTQEAVTVEVEETAQARSPMHFVSRGCDRKTTLRSAQNSSPLEVEGGSVVTAFSDDGIAALRCGEIAMQAMKTDDLANASLAAGSCTESVQISALNSVVVQKAAQLVASSTTSRLDDSSATHSHEDPQADVIGADHVPPGLPLIAETGATSSTLDCVGDAEVRGDAEQQTLVSLQAVVCAMNYNDLEKDTSLKLQFEAEMQSIIAQESGVSTENVAIKLSSGSVIVKATIDLPLSSAPAAAEKLQKDGVQSSMLKGARQALDTHGFESSGISVGAEIGATSSIIDCVGDAEVGGDAEQRTLVSLQAVVCAVNHNDIVKDTPLKLQFEAEMQSVIAQESGVSTENVAIELSSGSVIVKATIDLPLSSAPEAAQRLQMDGVQTSMLKGARQALDTHGMESSGISIGPLAVEVHAPPGSDDITPSANAQGQGPSPPDRVTAAQGECSELKAVMPQGQAPCLPDRTTVAHSEDQIAAPTDAAPAVAPAAEAKAADRASKKAGAKVEAGEGDKDDEIELRRQAVRCGMPFKGARNATAEQLREWLKMVGAIHEHFQRPWQGK